MQRRRREREEERRRGRKLTLSQYFFHGAVIQLNILHFELIRCKRHDLSLISREEVDEEGRRGGREEGRDEGRKEEGDTELMGKRRGIVGRKEGGKEIG